MPEKWRRRRSSVTEKHSAHADAVTSRPLPCGCRLVRCAECKEGFRMRCRACGGGVSKTK